MNNNSSNLAAVVVIAVAMCLLAAIVQADSPASSLPEAPERDLVIRVCTACHAPEIVIAKHHSAEEWDDIIATMMDRGAIASEDEQQQILEYLVHNFGHDTRSTHD